MLGLPRCTRVLVRRRPAISLKSSQLVVYRAVLRIFQCRLAVGDTTVKFMVDKRDCVLESASKSCKSSVVDHVMINNKRKQQEIAAFSSTSYHTEEVLCRVRKRKATPCITLSHRLYVPRRRREISSSPCKSKRQNNIISRQRMLACCRNKVKARHVHSAGIPLCGARRLPPRTSSIDTRSAPGLPVPSSRQNNIGMAARTTVLGPVKVCLLPAARHFSPHTANGQLIGRVIR